MECEDEKTNLVLKYLELIDISSEDDFLIASPFYDSLEDLRLSVKLENINELFGAANSPEIDNAAEVLHQRKQLLPSESRGPGRPSFLRKSLAWDSAFFTSAGVLDPEELCFINKGFNTSEACLLPGIQEDVRMRGPYDSESAYGSDGFYLESLDGDPFEDVRASIDNINKMSSMNCESGFGQAGIQKFRSSEKVDVGYRNRVKSTPASKRQSIKPRGLERLKKEQHAARSGESNIQSLKPHKISGRVTPISAGQTKTASLGAYNVKTGRKATKTGSGQDLTVSKEYDLMNSNNLTTSSTTPPPKSSSKLSLTASKGSAVSCSSYNTSPSSSSSKYSFNSMRRKLDSRNNKLASPGFSIHLSLLSNHSSSTSPCCSIDGSSLESYSSTPITNQRYYYPDPSVYTTTFREDCLGNDVIQASDIHNDSDVQSSTCLEIQETRSTRNLRPSCLRMPSPKIGFFDEKSMVPGVRGNVEFHFGAQNALANNDVASNTKRFVKLLPAKISPKSGNIKHGSVQSASRIRPKNATQFQGLDNASPKVSSISKTRRNCAVTDSKAQTDLSPAMDRESWSKIRKVGSGDCDKRKVGVASSLKAEETRSKGILKNSMSIKSKGQKDDNSVRREATNSFKKKHEEACPHRLENNQNSHHENKKENLSNFEEEVNELSRYFDVIDISKDVAIELGGKLKNSHSQNCENYPEKASAPMFSALNGDQQQDSLSLLSKPNTLSRTPLADKTSVWNRSGS